MGGGLEGTSGPFAGNTLDAAYDEGGAGAGRIINIDAGPVFFDGGAVPGTTEVIRLDGYITFEEQILDPVAVLLEGHLYTRPIAGATQLFYQDDLGVVYQITPGGALNNTLDQAYDQGGAGLGRTITVDSGPVQLNVDATQADPRGIFIDIDGVIGAGLTSRGIHIDADGVTVGGAGQAYYAIHLEMDAILGVGEVNALLVDFNPVSEDAIVVNMIVQAAAGVAAGNDIVTNITLPDITLDTTLTTRGLQINHSVTNITTGDFDVANAMFGIQIDHVHTSTVVGAKTDPDTYVGRGIDIFMGVTTTGALDKINDGAEVISIFYDVTETLGTIQILPKNLINLGYFTDGTPDYIGGGAVNMLDLTGVDTGVPTYVAGSEFRGINIDLDSMDVSDANLTLQGILVTMPAAYGAAIEAAIRATGDGQVVELCNDTYAAEFTGPVLITGKLTVTGAIDPPTRLELAEQVGDPGATANVGKLYVKESAGVAELFYQGDDATVHQLTPVVGGGGTLDDAYDFGGAGIGRTITVDTGAVQFDVDATQAGGATGLLLDVDGVIAANQTSRGIHVDADGVTCGGGETFYGIHVDGDGMTVGGSIDLVRIDAKPGQVGLRMGATADWITGNAMIELTYRFRSANGADITRGILINQTVLTTSLNNGVTRAIDVQDSPGGGTNSGADANHTGYYYEELTTGSVLFDEQVVRGFHAVFNNSSHRDIVDTRLIAFTADMRGIHDFSNAQALDVIAFDIDMRVGATYGTGRFANWWAIRMKLDDKDNQGILIDQASQAAVDSKNLIQMDVDVGNLGGAGFLRAIYLDIDEVAVGTNGVVIDGFRADMTGFDGGLADLVAFHAIFDGTKSGGDVTRGLIVDSNMTLNNAGEIFYGIHVDMDGMTIGAADAGDVFGLRIDMDGITFTGVATNLRGIDITMPAAYGAGAEAAVRVTGDGRIAELCNDTYAGEFTGDVLITGKLTVTGLIDPTGMVFAEQATVPGGAPAAGDGVFWVRNDAPNIPMFTDDASDDHEIQTSLTPTEKSFAFRTRGAGTGTFYWGGFYEFAATDNDFNPVITFGTVNAAKGAHIFIVNALHGGGGDTTIQITGTSITDAGVRTAADTENLTVSNGAAANTYTETTKKWIGQVSILTTAGPDVLCNYGFVEAWHNNNVDFEILGLEAGWLAAATDAGYDVLLRHHKATGWTYNAGATPTPPVAIASLQGDYVTETSAIIGENGLWKRTNLSTMVDGSGIEGTIIEVVATSNNTIELGNFLLRIRGQ